MGETIRYQTKAGTPSWRPIPKKCKMFAILQAKLTHNVFLFACFVFFSFFLFIGFEFRRVVNCMRLMVAYKIHTAKGKRRCKKRLNRRWERRGKKITFRVHDFSFGDIQAIVQMIVKLDYVYQHSTLETLHELKWIICSHASISVFMCNAINSWVQHEF